MAIRCEDWDRIKREVGRLTRRESYLPAVAWTVLGIAASALLGWFPWDAAYAQFPTALQQRYSFVSPLLAVTAIAGAVVATFCFVVNYRLQDSAESRATDLIADMQQIRDKYDEQAEGA